MFCYSYGMATPNYKHECIIAWCDAFDGHGSLAKFANERLLWLLATETLPSSFAETCPERTGKIVTVGVGIYVVHICRAKMRYVKSKISSSF